MEQEQEIIPHHRESQHQIGAEPPNPVVWHHQLETSSLQWGILLLSVIQRE